jgi:hypothetical protein
VKKALLTVSVGLESEELSQFSRPTFTAFAERHDYRVFVLHEALDHRPASWSKLPLMMDFVGGWDTIVCIDIDAMIVRFEQDWFQQVLDMTAGSIAFAVESANQAPNCGLWVVRGKSEAALKYLQAVDKMDTYYNDACVEQEAVHHLLGYRPGIPSVVCARETVLLSSRFNDTYDIHDDAIVKHWAGQSHRVRLAGMSSQLGRLGLEPSPKK